MLGITDHATKHSWMYPMKERIEAFVHLKDFIEVKMKIYGQSIRYYHANLGKELISKAVVNLLKIIGSIFT